MRIFMAKNSNYDYEETMVTLTDEDGVDRDFYIDEIYEVDGKTYCAAIPGDVENVTEYYVFRLKDLGNDDFEMEDIDDEEEYDAAADAYEEKLDARAWSRMMEVRNYSTQGDMYGFRPTSTFCRKHRAIIEHIFGLLAARRKEVLPIFKSWITGTRG